MSSRVANSTTRAGRSCALWLCITTLGCVGRFEGTSASRSNAETPAAPEPQASGGGPIQSESCAPGLAGPGPSFLRRLSNWEYDNTVRDLLGTGTRASEVYGLVPDGAVLGYDNNAEVVGISGPVFDKFRAAARGLAAELTSDASRLSAFVGCDLAQSGCIDGFLRSFGAKAFRHQLSDEELSSLTTLAATASTGPDQVARVVEAVLLSPSFLFKPEVGSADATRADVRPLTGEEIAVRLSYLVIGSAPPDWLAQDARKGALNDADGVAAAALELMQDARARDGIAHFYRQWLRVDAPQTISRDPVAFPEFTPALASSMSREMATLVDYFVWSPRANLLDVLNARFSFVDSKLAALYGIPAPATDFARVDFPSDSHRGGLLTSAGFLTITSKVDRPAPILRGKFIREVLMCFSVPPPPPQVPMLPAPIPGQSERARLERHATDPLCAACHQMTDPIGFGLSGFDAIGKRRVSDEQGLPIDERGRINGPSPVDFTGGVGLGDALRAQPEVAPCVVTQFLRYALARTETSSAQDKCTQQQLLSVFAQSGNNLPDLLTAFVKSEAFRTRLTIDTEGAP